MLSLMQHDQREKKKNENSFEAHKNAQDVSRNHTVYNASLFEKSRFRNTFSGGDFQNNFDRTAVKNQPFCMQQNRKQALLGSKKSAASFPLVCLQEKQTVPASKKLGIFVDRNLGRRRFLRKFQRNKHDIIFNMTTSAKRKPPCETHKDPDFNFEVIICGTKLTSAAFQELRLEYIKGGGSPLVWDSV